MKRNAKLQLLLSFALVSEICYIVIASLGDLRLHIPTFLPLFAVIFLVYWIAARTFFGFRNTSLFKTRKDRTSVDSPEQALPWLERFFHKKRFGDTLDRKEILIVGLVFGVVFRVTMLLAPPSLSDDVYRYIWDGRVANNGINPYKYAPAADTLRSLRDSEYYPRINHKEISTIYPPVSQIVFMAISRVNPSVFAFKTVFMLFDILIVGALLLLLKRLRMDLNRVLIYAWNPLVIVEISGTAHSDVLGIFFMSVALWLMADRKLQRANVMMVLSFLTKFISALFLPVLALLRRHNGIQIVLVFVIVTALFYLPFADAGGDLFTGFLVYSSKWEFNASIFSALVSVLQSNLPQAWVIDWMITPHGLQADAATLESRTLDLALLVAKVSVSLVFIGLFVYYLARLGKDLKREGRKWLFKLGLIFFGALFLLNPTVQPWYLCWLLPFLVVAPNRAFLLLTGLVVLSYWILIDYTETGIWQESTWVKWVEYTPFYTLMLFDYVVSKVKR